MNELEDLVSLTMDMKKSLSHISYALDDLSKTLKRIELSIGDAAPDIEGKSIDSGFHDICTRLDAIHLQLRTNGRD